jgi:hypothetical protein
MTTLSRGSVNVTIMDITNIPQTDRPKIKVSSWKEGGEREKEESKRERLKKKGL